VVKVTLRQAFPISIILQVLCIIIIIIIIIIVIVIIYYSLSEQQAGQVWKPPYKARFLRISGALERKIIALFCLYPEDEDWFVSTSALQ